MKAPFRVLFNNDCTNIEQCISPYHKKGEDFLPEMLEASIDEAAGADVHLLQPGVGWVPWWKSKVLPAEEHYKWFSDTYGVEPDGFGKYMLAGGDLVGVFVNHCREKGQAPFISFRMNDGHHKNMVDAKSGDYIPSYAGTCITRFYAEHPEYRLSSDLSRANMRVHNWAIPEVREHKFAFIEELCENYDLDGFELDFTRHFSLFRHEETSREERIAIMTEFVRRVRKLLDRTAKPGQHRWLCVHAPAFLKWQLSEGIDLQKLVSEAGVDMVNLACYYNTIQQTDLPEIRKLIPNTAVYHEMSFCSEVFAGPGQPASKEDNDTFRFVTEEQFHTGAHLAYGQGADGISFFNFVYYREYGVSGSSRFFEPPFHVLKEVGDPDRMARMDQHYMLTNDWQMPCRPQCKLPKEISCNGPAVELEMDCFPPEGGWQVPGRMVVQSGAALDMGCLSAWLNGVELEKADDCSSLYKDKYNAQVCPNNCLRAWTVPPEVLQEGINRIEITMPFGEPRELVFLNLEMPVSGKE